MFKSKALSLFRKTPKDKTMNRKDKSPVKRVMKYNEVADSEDGFPLFKPIPEGTYYRHITLKVNFKLSIVTKEPIENLMEIYLIGQHILDNYNGPARSKPMYLALMIGGFNGLEKSHQTSRITCYEREFHGPIDFPYYRRDPIDWVIMPLSTAYECSMKGHTEVTVYASLTPTNMTGPSLAQFCEGHPRMRKPPILDTLTNFKIDTKLKNEEWHLDMSQC
ncbi:matrix protein [Dolphin rhabdovirus]|uniref:Matrix protein n=1 Tax=Dolphin rhabdovirus TaxID=1511639 RepID=A0A068EQ10_9RHAB|nr:matrix protein [Dolphin rhabdovirus]AID53190.1 matrix protein [Dolphin rhabdovirus]